MQNTVNAIAALLHKHNCYSTFFSEDEQVTEVLCEFINTQQAHALAAQYSALLNKHNTLVNNVANALYALHGELTEEQYEYSIYDTFVQ